ncbi:Uncharacterised protein [Klebsiella pneumoniae]|nr:Uncharacterised protein [Enterobacter hormaechei]VGG60183.1 Uncharacterised protein [Klebsiella pneumoniae]
MVVTPVNDCDRNARLFQFSDNGESTEPSPYHDNMMFLIAEMYHNHNS